MRISIVTPTYNSARFLNKYFKSFDNIDKSISIEFIFIDNCSTDNTLEIITNYSSNSRHKIIINSSKDSGPAQAINKGFKLSNYEIIGWLNSDDLYSHGAIKRAFRTFNDNPKLTFIYGCGRNIDEFGNDLGLFPSLPPSSILTNFQKGNFVCQPSIFFRKEILQEVGYLNEDLKTAFDFDWFIRIFKRASRKNIKFIDNLQAYSVLHDQCITRSMRRIIAIESMKTLHSHFGYADSHWVVTYVNELYAQYPFQESRNSLLSQVKKFIEDVKDYLKKEDLLFLINFYKQDKRLLFSRDNLFISVESDGWVSKNLIIKFRKSTLEAKKITLKCSIRWPKNMTSKNLILKITNFDGDENKVSIPSSNDFILNLEIPEAPLGSFLLWKIRTNQFFEPFKYIKNSSDSRKLSYQVIDVLIE